MAGKNEQLVKFSNDEANRLIKLYDQAEKELINEINRGLLKGNQVQYLQTMLKNCKSILDDLKAGSLQWCEEAIPDVYTKATEQIDQQLTQLGVAVGGFGAIHQQAAQILADNAYGRFSDVTQFIGRRVDDIYRTMALDTVRGSTMGYDTWRKAAQKFKDQLAEQGVTGFTDKAGKQWNMSSYAQMVARTTTMESHLEGTKMRLVENGNDLVKISTHSHPCKLCQPWEGHVLSITGKTEGYTLLDDAKSHGLFHPMCEHAYGLFVPELND